MCIGRYYCLNFHFRKSRSGATKYLLLQGNFGSPKIKNHLGRGKSFGAGKHKRHLFGLHDLFTSVLSSSCLIYKLQSFLGVPLRAAILDKIAQIKW